MPRKSIASPTIKPVVEKHIYLIRGQRVILDSDLADLYDVETSNLNKAVKRNLERFPEDFMFQLSEEETKGLTFQIGMSKASGRGGRRYRPYAFTEQGVAMLSGILRSRQAVQINIAIMRAFVRLRQLLDTNEQVRAELETLRSRQDSQGAQIEIIFDAIEELQKLLEGSPDQAPKPSIGFRPPQWKRRQ